MRETYYAKRRAVKVAEAKRLGNCQKCFKRKSVSGKTKCQYCINNELKHKNSKREIAKELGVCAKCRKRPASEGYVACKPCRDEQAAVIRKLNLAVRIKVLTHYSRGEPQCRCCGEKILCYLTLDHIDDDGASHRKEIEKKLGRGPTTFLRSIIKRGFVARLQVLCWNCQWAKRLNGGICPKTGIDMRIPAELNRGQGAKS